MSPYVKLLVSVVEDGSVLKAVPQIPSDNLSTLALFRQLLGVSLVLFLTYFWPTKTNQNKPNGKRTFRESFLGENRFHSPSHKIYCGLWGSLVL